MFGYNLCPIQFFWGLRLTVVFILLCCCLVRLPSYIPISPAGLYSLLTRSVVWVPTFLFAGAVFGPATSSLSSRPLGICIFCTEHSFSICAVCLTTVSIFHTSAGFIYFWSSISLELLFNANRGSVPSRFWYLNVAYRPISLREDPSLAVSPVWEGFYTASVIFFCSMESGFSYIFLQAHGASSHQCNACNLFSAMNALDRFTRRISVLRHIALCLALPASYFGMWVIHC